MDFISNEVVCLVNVVGFSFDVVRIAVVVFGLGVDVLGLKVLSFMVITFGVEVDVDTILRRGFVV